MTDNKNIPVLRFPEFEGEWVEKKLDEISEVKGGKRLPLGYSLQIKPNGYPYITVSDMNNGTVSLKNIKYVPSEIADSIKNYKINTTDIYISVAGTLGLIGIIPKELDNANLTENANKITNLKCQQIFLYQYLNSEMLRRLIKSVRTDNAQPKLAIYAIKKFVVKIPAFQEQQKIASFLTIIDKKIETLGKKKELLETYKKGVMQKLFSGEIRFKDVNGNDYPDWEEKYLSEVVDFENGKAHENDIAVNGKYIVVNSKFISSNGTIKKYSNSQISPLLIDSIVMVMSDVPKGKAIAKCYYIDCNDVYTLNQRICSLKPKNNHGKFLFYVLNRNKYFLSFDSGVGQTNLRKEEVLSCQLFLPVVIEEQQKIADFLTTIDNKIEKVTKKIDKVREYKKGLLQQMFV